MSTPSLVVAVGASAGGIPALSSFFTAVPADTGLAYVVILHLSPDHDSRLAQILQHATPMPVATVTGGRVALAADHVYVVSPRESLTVAGGWLVHNEAHTTEQRRAPIDLLFHTLADAWGERAACVVLSGTGADGAAGLVHVNAVGGLCLAQDPAEAEYGEMPQHAIDKGLADAVLPVADMAERLIAHRDRRRAADAGTGAPGDPPGAPKALHDVLAELQARTGHDFANYKPATVLRRVERRLDALRLAAVGEYAAYLRLHPEEAQALLRDLLISVTRFFRDPGAFAALARDVVPSLFSAREDQRQVRVWVAACATGEEAYSIAMLLAEHAATLPDAPSVQVFATDIDEPSLAVARGGFYSAADVADVSPERLRRFFAKDDDVYRVTKELRELVLFAPHNLIKDPPFSHLALVSCRNLLIYLNRTAQQRVLEVLHFALDDDGYLFLGGAESAEAGGDLFVPVQADAHIFRSRGGPPRISLAPTSFFGPTTAVPRSITLPPVPARSRRPPAELHQHVLELYASPSVIVTGDYDIVHLSERAARLLHVPPGEPSHNLLKVVRPELRLELRSALYRAGQHNATVRTVGLTVMLDDGPGSVKLEVRPITSLEAARGYFLVLFEDAGAVPEQPAVLPPASPPALHLEEEIGRVKDQLRDAIEQHETQTEELKASNEELQAINEELRSTTEELETSREELQSVNEELRTVNQELKVKIDELTQANNDVENLINSTDFGIVFLDRARRIKLYTPRALDVFNLWPTDLGRPLHHVTAQLIDVDVAAEVDLVVSRVEPTEREVASRDGRWFLMRLSPYRTTDDRIDGVVLSFVDVTERKRAGERLAQSEARLRQALEVDAIGVLFLDAEGAILNANEAFLRMSGFAGGDVESGRLSRDAWIDADRRDEIERALVEVRDAGHTVARELACRRPDGSQWMALLSATRLSDREVAMFVVDTTEQHRAVAELRTADRRRTEFLASLAHELRNPLAPVAAALEILRSEDAPPPVAAKARDIMQRQVAHMTRLVEDLVEVSRIALGKIELRREPVDLTVILRTAIEASAPAIRAARHTFAVDITPVALPVHGDAVRLTQVFVNLLRNAAKYTPGRGTIELSAAVSEDEGVVTVRDNGLGISPESLPHIFDLFTQGDIPPGQLQSGLGVGLTLARSLVEAHGGRIEATSGGHGRGATFTVRLPLITTDAVAADHPQALPLDISHHRIVVVDDNEDAATTLGMLLTALGAEVHVATAGPQALELVGTHRPTTVFVDLGMPGMDGFQVAREIRRRFADLAPTVVALTGWGQPQVREAVLSAGFDHHLTKPATLRRIEEILNGGPPGTP